eukprot:gnl/TRDRNA2_/TRDRNA2_192574_c0_seq1.p1 gnl/TRDRNA2_/TRDRNA2_192574_c0~~gnl/TRDRNA2_/TRDRNA2_192574_c0_seq1.p1  ORF type:complete len:491 (-),score=80.15 gnl/TRDRNA2_/TRDRNA2_192574_c0_seq1:39-1511(-)
MGTPAFAIMLFGPWAPFVFDCFSRGVVVLAALIWIEGCLVGMVPNQLRHFAVYAGMASFALMFSKMLLAGLFVGPTPDMNVTTEEGSFRSDTVPWATAGMRGWRQAMEDAHVVKMLDPALFPDVGLFAVLDGHGGSEVSSVASQYLAQLVADVARERLAHAKLKAKTECKPNLEEALELALPQLDAKLRAGAWGIGRLLPGLMHPFATVGSTACVAAVDFAHHEVIVANVGDSRAMLIRDGKAIALSEDHKPENPKERNRIQQAGGRVVKVGPCYRVDGNLNLSRALGDFHLKANAALPPEKQKVSAFADITRTPFHGGPAELLLVGCDGLFERCSNQDVADIVWPRVRRGLALKQVAKELLHACCARACNGHPVELGTDNETVILVKLPPSAPETTSSSPAASTVGHTTGGHGSDGADQPLRAGVRVQLHGLESESGRRMNGQVGVVEGPAEMAERFNVRLVYGGEVKSFKAAHLRPCEGGQPQEPSES